MSTTPSTLDVLRGARRLIAEFGWTQGAYAEDAHGCSVEPESDTATCFCISGALQRAASGNSRLFNVAYDLLDRPLHTDAVFWNDLPKRTREEVLALFDRVIAEQEALQ